MSNDPWKKQFEPGGGTDPMEGPQGPVAGGGRKALIDEASDMGIDTRGRLSRDIKEDIDTANKSMDEFIRAMDSRREARNANQDQPAPVIATEDVVMTSETELPEPVLERGGGGSDFGEETDTILVTVDGGVLTDVPGKVLFDPGAP